MVSVCACLLVLASRGPHHAHADHRAQARKEVLRAHARLCHVPEQLAGRSRGEGHLRSTCWCTLPQPSQGRAGQRERGRTLQRSLGFWVTVAGGLQRAKQQIGASARIALRGYAPAARARLYAGAGPPSRARCCPRALHLPCSLRSTTAAPVQRPSRRERWQGATGNAASGLAASAHDRVRPPDTSNPPRSTYGAQSA